MNDEAKSVSGLRMLVKKKKGYKRGLSDIPFMGADVVLDLDLVGMGSR